MAYIKKVDTRIGDTVVLTEVKSSLPGYFEIGTIVTITDVDSIRGYTFEDAYGNRVTEAGWSGFKLIRRSK